MNQMLRYVFLGMASCALCGLQASHTYPTTSTQRHYVYTKKKVNGLKKNYNAVLSNLKSIQSMIRAKQERIDYLSQKIADREKRPKYLEQHVLVESKYEQSLVDAENNEHACVKAKKKYEKRLRRLRRKHGLVGFEHQKKHFEKQLSSLRQHEKSLNEYAQRIQACIIGKQAERDELRAEPQRKSKKRIEQ